MPGSTDPVSTPIASCRFCAAPLDEVVADLGMSPLANSFVPAARADAMEPYYPLRALVCGTCKLVQLGEYETPDRIFSDYLYFSSYSTSWVEHARQYVETMLRQLDLGPSSQVVEIASNDGYLLQFFKARNVPVRGVEPAANVAAVAVERGIPTVVEFFGRRSAGELAADSPADLIVANNVLAHVPDLNDFVAGVQILLAPDGVVTMEFPHLLRLLAGRQWDTIYHEHFSYFSFLTVRQVFAAHGLRLFDVEELETHGGSLRVHGCHDGNRARPDSARVGELLRREQAEGLDDLETYRRFGRRIVADKWDIQQTLIDLKQQGLRIAGYGAPAKGNTMLNFCAVGRDILDFTCDQSPHKQGLLLPGTHIPIRAPEALEAERPDLVLILPWNLREEVVDQLSYVRPWGTRFLARTPELRVLP
jgi:SAM-dependent methyltransferase